MDVAKLFWQNRLLFSTSLNAEVVVHILERILLFLQSATDPTNNTVTVPQLHHYATFLRLVLSKISIHSLRIWKLVLLKKNHSKWPCCFPENYNHLLNYVIMQLPRMTGHTPFDHLRRFCCDDINWGQSRQSCLPSSEWTVNCNMQLQVQ